MRVREITSTTTRRRLLAAFVVALVVAGGYGSIAAALAFGGGASAAQASAADASATTEASSAGGASATTEAPAAGATATTETVTEPAAGQTEAETQPAPNGGEASPPSAPNQGAPAPSGSPSPSGPEASGETVSAATAAGAASPPSTTSVTPPATSSPSPAPQASAPHQAQGRGGVDGVGPIRHPATTRTRRAPAPAPAREPKSEAETPAGEAEPSPGEAPAVSVESLSSPLPNLAGLTADSPPAYLLPIYREAGARYHVPWSVLAAINQIESDYGRDLSVSTAGAVGWMQFMPETWRQWGVDADGDGIKNPYSPRDAIFAAARYLQASGASHDLAQAIFAYNHAAWYVSEVIVRARTLAAEPAPVPLQHGYSLPLDRRYMTQLGRTDDGVDIETAPDGALVYSMTPGIVTAVASDPAGFGPDYPVIEATSGALAGSHVYYGHVAQSLVRPGEHVAAGQPIAVMGHTGDAVSLGHGHIEIGFSDGSGTPVNQHGAVAATPSGAVMRSFLIELSSAFGVHNS
jgi:murein DD-endopeptidase MepM/ murein hydrolase activator NlpD